MPHEELREVAELGDREVGGEGCLLSFFSNDADTCTRQGLKLPFGISTEDSPTSAACIMLTSLPPSPIQQTRFLV